jgi:hypothetical protein
VSEVLFVDRGVFTIPAFEVAKNTQVPENKEELLAAIEHKLAKFL